MSDEERRAVERRFKAEGYLVDEVAVLRNRLTSCSPCASCDGSGEFRGVWRCRHCAGFGSLERARQAFLAHCAYKPAQLSTNLVTHPRGVFTKRATNGEDHAELPETLVELHFPEAMRMAINRLAEWVKYTTIWGETVPARLALTSALLRPSGNPDMGMLPDEEGAREKMIKTVVGLGLIWCRVPTEENRKTWGRIGTGGYNGVPPAWLPLPSLALSPSVDNMTSMQPHVAVAEAASHWPLVSFSPGLTWLTTTRLADLLRTLAIGWAKDSFELTIPENNPTNPGCPYERLDVIAPS